MHISDGTLEKLLVRSTRFSNEDIAALKDESTRSHRPLQQIVAEKNLIDDTSLTKLFSEYSGIPYVELDPRQIRVDVLERIPERIARQYNAILFKIDPDGLQHLAMEDPDDVQAVDFIQKQVGQKVKTYIAAHTNIEAALDGYRGDAAKELSDVIDVQQAAEKKTEEAVSDQDVGEDSPIAQTINLLLEYAIRSKIYL